jgi:hypothetical protein
MMFLDFHIFSRIAILFHGVQLIFVDFMDLGMRVGEPLAALRCGLCSSRVRFKIVDSNRSGGLEAWMLSELESIGLGDCYMGGWAPRTSHTLGAPGGRQICTHLHL